MDKLLIITPCYNEEEILIDSAYKLKEVLDQLIQNEKIACDSRIMFIDDGSKDKTWKLIEKLNSENPQFGGIKLSRNFGQQSALMAGYMYANRNCDLCITLDVDLQDDISIIPEMVDEYLNGAEVVTTRRKSRKSDSFTKMVTAKMFYAVIKTLGTEMKPEEPEYRLLSRKALSILSKFKERNPYPRDLIPRIGLPTKTVEFERKERMGGVTKYNYRKLINLAITAIVRSSNGLLKLPIIPIIISVIGIFVHIPSAIYWIMAFSIMMLFGYYIADIKDQVHARPVYIYEEII